MNPPAARPDPDALLAAQPRRRGRLKLFFGAAPGVGKTWAMLAEAAERRAQGLDVLVGWVDTHGRADTEAMLAGLEVLPRQARAHRGAQLWEFDLDSVLARRPALVVVDELAHSNAPGSRHPKRWQDVEELLAAGIDVYSAMNVQHLDSLNDVVARVTGVAVRERPACRTGCPSGSGVHDGEGCAMQGKDVDYGYRKPCRLTFTMIRMVGRDAPCAI